MGPHDGRALHEYDHERAERAVKELLIAIGENPEREGLKDTPARVARAFKENFAGLWQSPEDVLTTTFDIGHEELVIIRDIEVFSHCEHHLTPFHGVAHVGYIPSGKITGLSKVARLVDLFARRPQVQERLTSQIADAMVLALLEKETLDKDEIAKIFKKIKKRNNRAAWTGSAMRIPSQLPPVDVPARIESTPDDVKKRINRGKKSNE